MVDYGTYRSDLGQSGIAAGVVVPFEECNVVRDDSKSIDVKNILQPRTVTYARYRFSKLHNQMLVHIREELSVYVTRNFDEIDPSRLIAVPLFVSHYPSFRNNMKRFYDSVACFLSSKDNLVDFSWRFNAKEHAALYRWMMQVGRQVSDPRKIKLPEEGALFESRSFIVVNIVRCEEQGKLLVYINPFLLPFLLYYGAGNGGTCFDRDVALQLSSAFSFKMNELITDWCTSMDVKKISVKELRSHLLVPDAYDVSMFRHRCLDVAKAEIEAAGSKITFDYELKFEPEFGSEDRITGRQPLNCAVITLHRQDGVNFVERSRKVTLMMLNDIADKQKQSLCSDLAAKMVDDGSAAKFKSKYVFYHAKVESRKISADEFRNTLLKIVREMTGVDLRSDEHIRNSMLFERRRGRPSKNEVVTVGSLFDN